LGAYRDAHRKGCTENDSGGQRSDGRDGHKDEEEFNNDWRKHENQDDKQ